MLPPNSNSVPDSVACSIFPTLGCAQIVRARVTRKTFKVRCTGERVPQVVRFAAVGNSLPLKKMQLGLVTKHSRPRPYRTLLLHFLVGFHSLASFCASAICCGV